MATTQEKYTLALQKHLPRGVLWDSLKNHALFRALAIEFARIDQRAKDLLREFDPRTAVELLPEWEEYLGLPDECTPDDLNVFDRQKQVAQKWGKFGGISPAFYIEVGRRLDSEIEVEKARQFTVDVGTVEQPLFHFETVPIRVGEGTVEQPIVTYGWQTIILVTLPLTEIEEFLVGVNTVEEPLAYFGNALLECELQKLKPAEAGLSFSFKDEI